MNISGTESPQVCPWQLCCVQESVIKINQTKPFQQQQTQQQTLSAELRHSLRDKCVCVSMCVSIHTYTCHKNVYT